MAKSHLALVAPAIVSGTVKSHSRLPNRVRNADVRARDYLTNRRRRPAHQSRPGPTRFKNLWRD